MPMGISEGFFSASAPAIETEHRTKNINERINLLIIKKFPRHLMTHLAETREKYPQAISYRGSLLKP
jgi:hypothetical protein